MTGNEIKMYSEQYKNEPIIFFFKVEPFNARDDYDDKNREELADLCLCAIPLSEFNTDWNDNDDDHDTIPNSKETWCYVSYPENNTSMSTLKKALTENGGLLKLKKALKLIKEESEIADNGGFCTDTDVQYLHEGLMNLQAFYDILNDMMRNEEHKNIKNR